MEEVEKEEDVNELIRQFTIAAKKKVRYVLVERENGRENECLFGLKERFDRTSSYLDAVWKPN